MQESCDIIKNERYKILTPNGYKPFYGLKKSRKECVKVIHTYGEIDCSVDHKFIVDGVPTEIQDIPIGEMIEYKEHTTTKILRKIYLGIKEVYTPLDVEGHLYYASNVLSKNCDFMGSSSTLISANALSKMKYEDPIENKMNGDLRIYELPVKGAFYLIGVDNAMGVCEDYDVIQVIRIVSANQFEQVAVYANNEIKPPEFARVIYQVSKLYNDAYMIVESNGVGDTVINELWYNLGCDRLINTDKKGFGTKANTASKLKACETLKKLVDDGILHVRDMQTIQQLARFELVKGSETTFKGTKGTHDDLVSALYWAAYATIQPQVDIQNIKVKEEEAIDYTPVSVFSQGNDEANFWQDFK